MKDYLYVNWKGEGDYALVEQFGNKLSAYGVYRQVIKIEPPDVRKTVHIGYFKHPDREEMIRRLGILLQEHCVQMISQLRRYEGPWNTQFEVKQLIETKSKRPSQGKLVFIRCDSSDTSTWPEHGEWVLIVEEGWLDHKQHGNIVSATRFVASVNGPMFWHDEADGIYWAPIPKVNKL